MCYLSLNLLTTYINYAVPVYPAIPTSGIVTSLGDVALSLILPVMGLMFREKELKLAFFQTVIIHCWEIRQTMMY